MPLYELDGVRPVVPASGRFWIAPDAHVIGNVILEEDAAVWFGAVIRGDNDPIRIGARSNIQDNSVLHSDRGSPLVIGADCTIGHSVILHGCTIGDGVLIGMGSTVLNGAVIGDGCLVGANALVTEGKRFEAGWMILGSPAKAVRELGAENAARQARSAAGYVANWQRFKGTLKRVD
jgi:carbonic anhydrase/acetyltransferase-like protein (isoleucine patch superfamily)